MVCDAIQHPQPSKNGFQAGVQRGLQISQREENPVLYRLVIEQATTVMGTTGCFSNG